MSRFDRDGHGFPLYLEIAIGVTLGILVAALVIWQVAEWRAGRAVEDFARNVQNEAARIDRQNREQMEAQQRQAAQQRAAVAASQRAAEDVRRQAVDADTRREQAWARFYKKPAQCDESRGGTWTVECANDYIRAKRTFDERYDAGKL